MSKTRGPKKLSRQKRPSALCAWVSLGLSLLAGCSSSAPHTHSGDPLFGEYYPKGPNGQPMPPPPATKTSSAGVLPYPNTNSSTTTAALASNATLPGARPLAINENNGTNWALTSNVTTNPSAPVGMGSPIVQPVPRDTTIGTGQPVNQPATPPVAATTTTPPVMAVAKPAPKVTPASPIVPASLSTADDRTAARAPTAPMGTPTIDVQEGTLKGKGVTGIQQKAVAGGVNVSCYVPRRDSPGNYRYLETVAPDYASGLQVLLQQIDQ